MAEIKEGYDFINPQHYKKFSVEVIDMMVAIWGPSKTADHCEMCAFKYRLRMGDKPDQPVERDLEKVNWYLNKAAELRRDKAGCKPSPSCEAVKTELVSFDCGTDGLNQQKRFIETLDQNKGRIVHVYTLYKKKCSELHIADTLNYVVEYKIENKISK